jgi:hypothetical protein
MAQSKEDRYKIEGQHLQSHMKSHSFFFFLAKAVFVLTFYQHIIVVQGDTL